jgi:hypothetical protein
LFSKRLTLTLYLTSLTYPSAAYYMTINSDPINHDKADAGLNTTPCQLLPEQLLTRLSAKKNSASKTCSFSDFLLKAVCCYDYSQVKAFAIKKSISLDQQNLTIHAFFSVPRIFVLTLGKR